MYPSLLKLSCDFRKKSDERNKLKEKLFKLKEQLKETVVSAPANDSAKKRLLNLEDEEIINGNDSVNFISFYCDLLKFFLFISMVQSLECRVHPVNRKKASNSAEHRRAFEISLQHIVQFEG